MSIYPYIGVFGIISCIWCYFHGKKISRLEAQDGLVKVLKTEGRDLRRWVKDIDSLVAKSQRLKNEISDNTSLTDTLKLLHDARDSDPDST